MTRLSPRERTLIRWAVGAVALYLLLGWVVLPYWDSVGETRFKADSQEKRVRNYHKILQRQGQVKAELETLRRQTESLEKGLLDSAGDALAGAEIQGLVKDIAAAHGLTIRNSDLLPVEKISPRYSKVSTRVGLRGPLHQFVNLVVAMGSGSKILFVEDLRIRPVKINVPKEKDIRVTLTISALKQAEPEKVASAARGGERP